MPLPEAEALAPPVLDDASADISYGWMEKLRLSPLGDGYRHAEAQRRYAHAAT